MWFAIFDFEYKKDRDSKKMASMGPTECQMGDQKLFMRNPQLYKLGMNGSCFSLPILGYWILYAIWHAFVIFNINFYTLSQEDAMASNG
jgi:hypothetical protein